MIEQILEEIGLTKSEIKVYLALLELGNSSTGKIVDKSKVASSKIYELLDKLIQKGMVSFIIKSGVKYYEAAPPARLIDYVNEKEQQFLRQKKNLTDVLPELELKQKLSQFKSEATIFKGLKGAETAFRYFSQSMKNDDEWIAFVVSFANQNYSRLLTRFHKWRSKRGLSARLIFNEKDKQDGKEREKLAHTKVKYMPDEFKTPAVVNVAGNITLINIMAEDVTVFMIESKEVADSFRNQFEKLWHQETIITEGFEALQNALHSYIDGLEKYETYNVLGAVFGDKYDEKTYADFFQKIHKERSDKGIKARMLFQQGTERILNKYEKYREQIYRDVTKFKFLPYKTDSPVAIFPSKKKTLLVIQKKDPIVITINNQEVSQSFKNHFESLWNQETRVVKGMDAIKIIFEELLESKHCDFIGARGYFVGRSPKKYIDDWERRAIKNGFTMRNIVDKETKGHRITTFPFAQTKYIIPKEFSTLSVFWIYNNKVVISNWTQKEPIAIVIENKHLYKMYKEQFELLWNKGFSVG
mgnify:CR=1 FL=1